MAEEDAAHAAYTAKARDLCIAPLKVSIHESMEPLLRMRVRGGVNAMVCWGVLGETWV